MGGIVPADRAIYFHAVCAIVVPELLKGIVQQNF